MTHERVDDRIAQSQPRRFDDVLRDADGGPDGLAVGGVDEHPRDRLGAPVGIQHPDLVVGQANCIEFRVVVSHGLPERVVECVHRTVALTDRHPPVTVDDDAQRRLRVELGLPAALHQHLERLDLEEVEGLAGGPAQQHLQRGIGHLEVISGVLEPLQLIDHIGHGGLVDLDAELGGFQLHRRPSRQVAEQEACAVADGRRVDMLVAVGASRDGAGVQARLVGER